MTTADRWRRSVPLFVAGAVGIVAGGLVAAITGPTGWGEGSWVAAFLVLVVGVAKIAVGAGQAELSAEPQSRAVVVAEAVTWNAGSAAVLAGTLAASPIVVTVGSLILLAALGLALGAVRHSSERWVQVYRALLLLVLVSVPIGVVLSWVRH